MELYDILLAKRLGGGGGGSAVINPLSVSANGTYSAPGGVDGYNPVKVAVPMPSGTYNIGANGDYDIASYASVAVSVPGIVPSGTSNITANGVYDVTNYESASVNVSGGGTDTRFKSLVEKTISGSVEDSTITNIGTFAFVSCTSITAVNFPNVTRISTQAFAGCTGLISASFPNATSIYGYVFSSCWSLTDVNIPNAEVLSDYAFAYCTHLSYADFPKVTKIWAAAFSSCSSLAYVSFPAVNMISYNAFRNCVRLLSAYFLGSSVPTLGANAFTSTPIGGYTTKTDGVYGSIFVPSSLYNTYITAENWTTYSARIVSV